MKAVFLAWLLLLQAAGPSKPGYGTIAGRILLVDGTPAANSWVGIAYVRDTPTTGNASQVMTHTDNDGRYRLTNVPPGIYCVKAGIQVALTSACGPEEPVVTVSFNAAVENTNVRLTTPPGRRVAGRVVLEGEGNAGLLPGAGMRADPEVDPRKRSGRCCWRWKGRS